MYVWYGLAASVVLFLPGLTWLIWFHQHNPKSPMLRTSGQVLPELAVLPDILENLAQALGLSLALTALVSLLFYLLGWRISSLELVGLYVLTGMLAMVGGVVTRKRRAQMLPGSSPI